MTHEYDDIINLPHHVSSHHPPMSMEARAAQFAPFAALTGHHAAINATARRVADKEKLLAVAEDYNTDYIYPLDNDIIGDE